MSKCVVLNLKEIIEHFISVSGVGNKRENGTLNVVEIYILSSFAIIEPYHSAIRGGSLDYIANWIWCWSLCSKAVPFFLNLSIYVIVLVGYYTVKLFVVLTTIEFAPDNN